MSSQKSSHLKEKRFALISGVKLIALREAKGFTQKEFADLVGVSRATVVTWEGKERVKFPEDKLKNAISVLGCTVEDLTKDLSQKIDDDADLLDHPLVKSYVEQINLQRKMIEMLEKEIAQLRDNRQG